MLFVSYLIYTDLGTDAIVPLPPHGARGGGEVGEDALGPHSLKVLRVGHHLAEEISYLILHIPENNTGIPLRISWDYLLPVPWTLRC